MPRRRSGGRRSGIRWDRLGRTILLIVLAVVIFNYFGPAKTYWDQRRVATGQREQLKALRTRNQVLKQRVHGLTEPRLLQQHAREIGMVKSGEQPIVVQDIPRGLPAQQGR